MGGRGVGGGAVTLSAGTAEGRVEGGIRDLFAEGKTVGGGERVALADLRQKLSGMSRDDQDAALRRLGMKGRIFLTPQEDQKRLTAAGRAAALTFGGEKVHWVRFES